MGQAMWFFVFFVLLHVSSCQTQMCREHLPENKFLNNIDKLLNLKHLKIAGGMYLRKKEHLSVQNASNDSTCDNKHSFVDNIGLRIRRMMETHVIEFDLSSVVQKEDPAETPRRRKHHQQQTLSLMLMGISLFLMIFVPMGFNFLSALGGKAFLMAKLALLLASVNGLKRVANGGVHYGLYQTPPEPNYHQFNYDRFDRPRR